jgi:hypothetical protein
VSAMPEGWTLSAHRTALVILFKRLSNYFGFARTE